MELNKILYGTLAGGLLLLGASCSEKNPVDKSTSVITDNVVVQNDFDKWLYAEFLLPYNIEVKYKFEDNESDRRYNLSPAAYSQSVQLAHLLKYLGLQPYDDVTGSTAFIRQLFPKIVAFIGSAAYNTNGTMVLGTAEGGRKMTLYRVNSLTTSDVEDLNDRYFHTIHHEFAHIQNQTKPYSVDFEQISAKEYVSDAWNNAWDKPENIKTTVAAELQEARGAKVKQYDALAAERTELLKIPVANRTQAQKDRIVAIRAELVTLAADAEYQAQRATYQANVSMLNALTVSEVNALRAGFISPYASSQHGEDFVELQAFYTTDKPEVWQRRLLIAGTSGRAIILQKFAIVRNYLQTEWAIDIDKLRDNVLARQDNLSAQDLDDLTVN